MITSHFYDIVLISKKYHHESFFCQSQNKKSFLSPILLSKEAPGKFG